ncbi:cupin domain-containing protein [Acetobacter conturbans]|uniref:cupin domain-containing protein n=1 Tax=Acetobacter conturbans TaxID=1737472 RepID=UPI0015699DC7
MADIGSVIDLRDFAEKFSDPAGDFLTSRHALPFPDERITVDVLAPAGSGVVERLPADTFLFVLAGSLSLNGTETGVNEGLIITAGTTFDWKAPVGTKLIRMQVQSPETAAPAIIKIDTDVPLSPSSPPPAQYLTGPTPDCENSIAWRSADGQFYGGIWASTPYYRRPVPYAHYELMFLCEGSVTFVSEEGERRTFNAGDVFIVGRGAVWAWDSECAVRKMFVIFRPA